MIMIESIIFFCYLSDMYFKFRIFKFNFFPGSAGRTGAIVGEIVVDREGGFLFESPVFGLLAFLLRWLNENKSS